MIKDNDQVAIFYDPLRLNVIILNKQGSHVL